MLSARHNEKSIVEGLQCGANDYVTKPFRRGELLARIRMALRSRNAAATEDARDNSEENGACPCSFPRIQEISPTD